MDCLANFLYTMLWFAVYNNIQQNVEKVGENADLVMVLQVSGRCRWWPWPSWSPCTSCWPGSGPTQTSGLSSQFHFYSFSQIFYWSRLTSCRIFMSEDTFLVFGNRLTLELESFAQFTDDKTCFKKQQNNRAKICIISYSWLFTVGSSEHFMQPFPYYVFYFWKPVFPPQVWEFSLRAVCRVHHYY